MILSLLFSKQCIVSYDGVGVSTLAYKVDWPRFNPWVKLFYFFCVYFSDFFCSFLYFFWDPWCLRRPMICKSSISKHHFITNNFQMKFLNLDHCARSKHSRTVSIWIFWNPKFQWKICPLAPCCPVLLDHF